MSDKPQVLVTRVIAESAEALLQARDDVDYEIVPRASAADIDARLEGAHGIVLGVTPFGADVIARAPRLRVLSRYGVGYDNIDVPALTERRIPLTVVGDANAVPVAEHALAMMLALTRNLIGTTLRVRGGDWDVRHDAGRGELFAKTVLVVGFGRIGRRVASRCAAFEMDVIVADPFVEASDVEAAGYRYVADFRAALPEADIVTLHLPGNADSSPLMRRDEFVRMKAGAWLINVARGTLLDEEALVAALRSGRLSGAGLDVTRREPPEPDNPLLALDNVILSPHCAALTDECNRRMSEVSVQNVLDAFDGRLDPDHVINKEVLG